MSFYIVVRGNLYESFSMTLFSRSLYDWLQLWFSVKECTFLLDTANYLWITFFEKWPLSELLRINFKTGKNESLVTLGTSNQALLTSSGKQTFGIFTNTQNWQYIANFVLVYICSFLLYFEINMSVNVKIDLCGYKRITFQGCKLHWPSWFQMPQLKWSWQYWHYCIVANLWKTLLN